MLYKTAGIVLHTVKYGETSVVVRIFTELFGIQSYLVNGVRTSSTKSAKANLLQPACILDLVVYHREQKNLQRISEFKPAYIYHHLYASVIKNAIALYISELMYRGLSEPEPHPELFRFVRQALEWMDRSPAADLAHLPLYFTLKVSELMGFKVYGRYGVSSPYLDLREGQFVSMPPASFFLEKQDARYTDLLLRVTALNQLPTLKIPGADRNTLLMAYLEYLKLHLPAFYDLRSPRILKEVLR